MIKAILINIIFFLTLTQNAIGQYVSSTGAKYEPAIHDFTEIFLPRLLQYATPSERKIASVIEIIIIPNKQGRFVGTPISLKSGANNRKIIIDDTFLFLMDGYFEAFFMQDVLKQPNFAEEYVSHFLSRISPLHDNQPPLTPGEYAGWNQARIQKFRLATADAFQGLKIQVLSDILLHEIAHQALEAFYNPAKSPSKKMIATEKSADEWSTNIWSKYAENNPSVIDKNNTSGRAFAISLIREIDIFHTTSPLKNSRSHPSMSERINNTFKNGMCNRDVFTVGTKELCSLLEAMATRYASDTASIFDYQKRLKNGEAHAAFRLGMIFLSRSELVKACNYFEEAYNLGADSWVKRFLAWCYEPESPTNRSNAKLAEELYYEAADDGWRAAQIWVEKFGTK